MIGADRFIHNLTDDKQKQHAYQRYAIGISDIDMWNFDTFLADVMVKACDWFIECGSTSPWHLETDQWHDILRSIRDGFSIRNSDGSPNPPPEVFDLMRDNYRYFWD